jgi:hypothetical protein
MAGADHRTERGTRHTADGVARAHARLGIAVTRGLLLDLVATGDVDGVDAAMEAFIAVYVPWLERAAAQARNRAQ